MAFNNGGLRGAFARAASALTIVVLSAWTITAQDGSLEQMALQAATESRTAAQSVWLEVAKSPGAVEAFGADFGTAEGRQLGDPLAVFWLSMDAAALVARGERPLAAAARNDQMIYPVMNRDRTSSSGLVTVSRSADGWRRSVIGRAVLAQALVSTRRADAAQQKRDVAKYFALEIPALRQIFLARTSGAETMVIPLETDTRYEFKQGAAVPVNVALRRLLANP